MKDAREINREKERAQKELESLVTVDPAEFSVGKKPYAACKVAGGAMVKAMLVSKKSRSTEEKIEAYRLAGVEPDEKEREAGAALSARAKDAVGAFADAHLKAHSLQYMEDYRLYSLADRSVYGEIPPFSYDRDRVDAVIAAEAKAKYQKLSLAPPDKSSLIVGKYASSAEAVFEVNCHSPIPLKGAASNVVRVAEGALCYNALKGEKLENNERNLEEEAKAAENVKKKTAEERKPREERRAREETERVPNKDARRAELPDKAPIRPHPEDKTEPHRKRTAIAAEILFREKKTRGVLLSPDPLLQKQPRTPQVKEQ